MKLQKLNDKIKEFFPLGDLLPNTLRKRGMIMSYMIKQMSEIYGIKSTVLHSVSSQFYNIGEIFTTDITNKEGPLSLQEREIMMTHPRQGYDLLISSGFSEMFAEKSLYHHENFDGSGYPYGKSGNEIPLECQMVRLCDEFIGYRNANFHKKEVKGNVALHGMTRNGNKEKFNPELLELMYKHYFEFEKIYTDVSNMKVSPLILSTKGL